MGVADSLLQVFVRLGSPHEGLHIEHRQCEGLCAVGDAGLTVPDLQLTRCTVVEEHRHIGLVQLAWVSGWA